MDRTTAAVALTMIPGVGIKTARDIWQLTQGHPEIALEAELEVELPRHTADLLREHGGEALGRADREVEWCLNHDIRILLMGETDYPRRLTDCPTAPVVLYYRGNADLNGAHFVSIVGTRRPSAYGRDVCRFIAEELAQTVPDAVVVSGLAYGVDVCAHREALAGGLQTVGVLAHGLDRIYPAEHRQTAKEMIRQGGLLTEFVKETIPEKGNFVQRNRIVAALSDATIVVESGLKGGALITARLADDFNRPVFACPGRLRDSHAEGCIRLVANQKALLFSSIEALAEELNWDVKSAKEASGNRQTELFANVSPLGRQLLELIEEVGEADINFLIEKTGRSYTEVSNELFNLDMSALVRLLPGNVYRLF